jgi:hypothetical protein
VEHLVWPVQIPVRRVQQGTVTALCNCARSSLCHCHGYTETKNQLQIVSVACVYTGYDLLVHRTSMEKASRDQGSNQERLLSRWQSILEGPLQALGPTTLAVLPSNTGGNRHHKWHSCLAARACQGALLTQQNRASPGQEHTMWRLNPSEGRQQRETASAVGLVMARGAQRALYPE